MRGIRTIARIYKEELDLGIKKERKNGKMRRRRVLIDRKRITKKTNKRGIVVTEK